MRIHIILLSFFLLACSSKEQGVYFSNIKGKLLSVSPGEEILLQFGLKGMVLKAAGILVEGTGHHHIIINGSFIPKGTIVPKDENHIHFGDAQAETRLHIKPDMKTLTLQFADGAHRSYGKEWSYSIQVKQK